jgi:hypothetical protein
VSALIVDDAPHVANRTRRCILLVIGRSDTARVDQGNSAMESLGGHSDAADAADAAYAAASVAAASVWLYSRLWLDLETLSDRLAQTADGMPDEIDLRLEMFRLELIVLLDHCDSARWRSLLSSGHRFVLRATLQHLLCMLAVAPDRLERGVVAQAQNQLFDAVLRHCGEQFGEAEHARPPAMHGRRRRGGDRAGLGLRGIEAFTRAVGARAPG